jgi:hypothetical protein
MFTKSTPVGSSLALLAALALGAPAIVGCEKKAETASTDTHAHDGHDHAPGDGHDHGDAHDHGPTVELGAQTIGGYTVKASRDGELTAGADAPIDVWITGGTGRVAAVRFWIGTQDAKGSMKAKAELEKDNWHTHAEVPSPLPAGSMLWVEIETEGAEPLVCSFALNPATTAP